MPDKQQLLMKTSLVTQPVMPAYGDPPQRLFIDGDESMFLQLTSIDDGDALYELVHTNRKHLQTYQPWAKTITREELQVAIEECVRQIGIGEWLQYRVMLPRRDANHLMIGTVTFYDHDPYNRTAKLGFWLAEDAQGHGYAKRAAQKLIQYGFEAWNLAKITVEIQPGNERSEGLASRLGARPTDEFVTKESNGESVQQRVWVLERP
jgi:RimJ/RimL family protein N-acetyltransferase